MAEPLLKFVVNNGSIKRTVAKLTKDGKPQLNRDGEPVEVVREFMPGEKIELTAEEAAQYDPHFLLTAEQYAKTQQMLKLQAELVPEASVAE